MKEPSLYWQKSYGWRAGTRYIEPGASAADVIRYEQQEQGNALNVPLFFLSELERKPLPARDIVWVCRIRQHARRYSGRGIGQPYKEDIAPQSLILATDGEPETGYLLLQDATRLDPEVIRQFETYRRANRLARKEVQKFPNIPVVSQLAGWHVTDDPQKVIPPLQTGQPLDSGEEDGRQHDLQTGGLYFSEAPLLWTGRSSAIWDFAKTVTPEQREAIVQAVLADERITGDWYVTGAEKQRAERYMRQYSETGNVVYLHFLAEQPFNIKTWKPDFLQKVGITNAKPLQQIEVRAEGNFANLNSVQITPQLIADLKAAGYDGAFVTSSMAYLPQSVVWNNEAIVRCGTYTTSTRETEREAGKEDIFPV